MLKILFICIFIYTLSACKQNITNTENVSRIDNRLSISEAYEAYSGYSKDWRISSASLPASSNQNLWQLSASKMHMNLQQKRPRVARQIKSFLNNPQFVKNSSYRARPYYHYVLNRVLQRRLPAEMALLPFIESGYNPMATSRAKAVGAWQFIESTGNEFGLNNTAWYDARRDVLASTEAALTLLKQLNKRFSGDWLLALAAYNCGAQCVQNAINKNIKKGKPIDFWSLPLPKETRHYIPKFLAIATVIKHAKRLSIPLAPLSNQRYFSIVKFNGRVDLRQLAIESGVSADQLFGLNAGYKIKQTNPSGTHRLIIPVSKTSSLKQSLANLVTNNPVSINVTKALATKNAKTQLLKRSYNKQTLYQVQNGDTLRTIAEKFSVTLKDIQRWNKNLSVKKHLYENQKITIMLIDKIEA